MEGVLVSAQRANTPITVTVVTDATGRYTFPRNRLDPGRYMTHVRATGYDLANSESDPGPVDIARALPLAYGVASLLIGMSVLLVYADIVNPVRIT